MKSSRKHTIFLLIINVLLSLTTAVGLSYAAYVYNNLYDNVVDYNTGSFSENFQSGNGTVASPYIISNWDQLRNLQKLNVLGVFSANTYFSLGASFTWSEDDLLPIGTEDTPFISQFNGMGYTITNLTVEGSHTNDIGMFGYVGIEGSIKNFILNRPLVKVGRSNNPSGLRSTNPLAPLLQTEAASLGLTLSSDRKYFTITNNKTTVTATDGQILTINYKSYDNTLVEWDSAQNRFNVKTPPSAETGKFYTTQISATVYAYLNEKVVAYTLERWQINVNADGTVNIAATNQNVGFWKTIHAGVNEGAGPHETYVGFFIGHLDGTASHLGLYGTTSNSNTNNGKIEIEGRAARSYTTLIGRNFMDNLKDDANGNLRSEFVDLGALPLTADKTFPAVNQSASVANFFSETNANGTRKKAIDISTFAGFDASQRTYMRLNPSSKVVNGNQVVVFKYNHVYQEIDDPTTNLYGTPYFINEGLAGYTGGSPGFLRFGPQYHAGANGFWVYLSSNFLSSGFFNVSKDKTYEVMFRVRYTAKGSTDNNFQILYNFYNPSPGFLGSYHEYDYWRDLAIQSGTDGLLYTPSDYPLVQTIPPEVNPIPTNPVFEQEVSFELESSTFDGFLGSGTSQAVFLLGAGQNGKIESASYDDNKINKAYFNVVDPTTFELNILSIDMIISSLDSNMGRQTEYVDYINNTPTFNAGTGKWTNWNTFSNTRIYFNVTEAVINGGSAKYRFFRNRDTITAYYTTTNSVWNPAYNTDYRRATINSGY